jgi:hypothetical protein
MPLTKRLWREIWWWPLAGIERCLDLVGQHGLSDDLRYWMEDRLPGPCAHPGPDAVSCELLPGHKGLHLQRLTRGYVEWER